MVTAEMEPEKVEKPFMVLYVTSLCRKICEICEAAEVILHLLALYRLPLY